MPTYVLKKNEIEQMEGLAKTHFLNADAQRTNKSLGDKTGLNNIGFHIIEVPPGKFSTEFHVHHFEEECTYVLAGTGKVTIGDDEYDIAEGDFIGYRAGGEPHTMWNTDQVPLKCIVVGQRLAHDVGDYPHKRKRIYRNEGLPWNLVDFDDIDDPVAGEK